jgi:hypothetical protein
VAGEIQEDKEKDGQTSEHRNRQWCLNRKSQKKKKNYWTFILNPEQRRVFQLVFYNNK